MKINSFNYIQDERITYSVWVSFCEIYQDNCYDLLKKVPESKKRGERTCLKLCEERDGLPYVKNLREIQVSSADEAFQIMMIGHQLITGISRFSLGFNNRYVMRLTKNCKPFNLDCCLSLKYPHIIFPLSLYVYPIIQT